MRADILPFQTSGLDSSTALSVVTILKKLAHKGLCTCVCTIHQPQSKIFAMFDNLILMRDGRIVYQGDASRVLNFFKNAGFPCPPLTNPADHIIQILVLNDESDMDKNYDFDLILSSFGYIANNDVDAQTQSTIEEGKDGLELTSQKIYTSDEDGLSRKVFKDKDFIVFVDIDLGHDKPEFSVKANQPFIAQLFILYQRSLHALIRRWDIIAMNIFVTMLIATFVCMSGMKA